MKLITLNVLSSFYQHFKYPAKGAQCDPHLNAK